MSEKLKNYLGVAIILGILLLSISAIWYSASYSKSVLPQRTFSVSGDGESIGVPDVAILRFGVLTEGGIDVASTQSQNTEKSNAIISFLKELRVDSKDIKTESYSIDPRHSIQKCDFRDFSRSCPPAEIVGYSVSQRISVKIRDFDVAPNILKGVVERGANNVSGPNFVIDDPSLLLGEAREDAIEKAKQNAEQISRAGNFRLGKIVSISEGFHSPYLNRSLGLESADASGGGPIIEPGSQRVSVSVNIVYEIK